MTASIFLGALFMFAVGCAFGFACIVIEHVMHNGLPRKRRHR